MWPTTVGIGIGIGMGLGLAAGGLLFSRERSGMHSSPEVVVERGGNDGQRNPNLSESGQTNLAESLSPPMSPSLPVVGTGDVQGQDASGDGSTDIATLGEDLDTTGTESDFVPNVNDGGFDPKATTGEIQIATAKSPSPIEAQPIPQEQLPTTAEPNQIGRQPAKPGNGRMNQQPNQIQMNVAGEAPAANVNMDKLQAGSVWAGPRTKIFNGDEKPFEDCLLTVTGRDGAVFTGVLEFNGFRIRGEGRVEGGSFYFKTVRVNNLQQEFLGNFNGHTIEYQYTGTTRAGGMVQGEGKLTFRRNR